MASKNCFQPKWVFDQQTEVKAFPEWFYHTDAISQRAAQKIEETPPGQPLFSYVAFFASHFPLQAPAEKVDRFRGRYQLGLSPRPRTS